MKKSDTEKAPELLADLELGRSIGHREAFSLMAGRCSAADVESLRRIREEKLYRDLDCTWAEFCTDHLHVSRRNVDRAIGYLQEFGPSFFHLAQLTHIGVNDYRAIAQHVTDDGLNAGAQMIALLPENSGKLSAAIADLLKQMEAKERDPRPPSFDAMMKRCESIAETLESLAPALNARQQEELTAVIAGIRNAAAALEAVMRG